MGGATSARDTRRARTPKERSSSDATDTYTSGGREMALNDEQAARLGRLERDYGGLSARVSGLERDIGSVLPMVGEFATLNERVKNFGDDLNDIKATLARRDQEAERERKESQQDRRIAVRWAITLTITIVLGLLTLFGAILSAGGHL